MQTLTAINYIARAKEKAQSQFAETSRLRLVWQAAFSLWQQQPTQDNKQLAHEAHEAYKAEQNRAMGAAYERQRQSLAFQAAA